MQLLIFYLLQQQLEFWAPIEPRFPPQRVWWAQMDFLLFGAMHQVAGPLSRTRPLRDFGGLKWTRTIDLTLIRRVL